MGEYPMDLLENRSLGNPNQFSKIKDFINLLHSVSPHVPWLYRVCEWYCNQSARAPWNIYKLYFENSLLYLTILEIYDLCICQTSWVIDIVCMPICLHKQLNTPYLKCPIFARLNVEPFNSFPSSAFLHAVLQFLFQSRFLLFEVWSLIKMYNDMNDKICETKVKRSSFPFTAV